MPITPIQEEVLVLVLREKLPDLSKLSQKQVVSKVGKQRFEEEAQYLYSYLEASCGANLSKNEQLAILSQVFRCLVTYIKQALGLPITLKTVFDCFSLLSHAVDLSYPGYAEAGMLKAVISPTRLPMELKKAS